MTELQERTSRLERKVGTGKEERRLIKVLTGYGSRHLLTEYDPVTKQVIRQRRLTDAELDEMRAAGEWPSQREQRLRVLMDNLRSTAEWRMRHWPEQYPDLRSALAKGREDGLRDDAYGEELYETAFDLLLEAELGGGEVEGQ